MLADPRKESKKSITSRSPIRKLFAPAIFIVNRLKYSGKFILISTFFIMPIAVSMYLLIGKNINYWKDFTKKESKGIEHVYNVRILLEDMQTHRALSMIYAAGDRTVGKRLSFQESEIDRDLKKVEMADGGLKDGSRGKVQAVREEWGRLKGKRAAFSAEEQYERHTRIIMDIQILMELMAYDYDLILDPDTRSFFLVNLAVRDLPLLTEQIGRLRALGVYALTGGRLDTSEKDQLIAMSGASRVAIDMLRRDADIIDAQYALRANAIHRSIRPQIATIIAEFEDNLKLLDTRVIYAERLNMHALEFFDATTKGFEGIYGVYDLAKAELANIFSARIRSLERQGVIAWGATLTVIAAVVYLLGGFYLSVTETVFRLGEATRQMSHTELPETIIVESDDELSEVVSFFNKVALALRRSHELLLHSEQMAHIGSWDFDVAARTMKWSPEMYRIYQLDPANVPISVDCLFLKVHPEDAQTVRENLERGISTGRLPLFEYRIVLSDGSVRHLCCDGEISSYTFRGWDNMTGFVQDITIRKKAEEERQKLFLAVEDSSDWVLIADRDGKIEYVNRAVEEMSGYSKEELLGQNPKLFKSGKQDERVYKELWDTILTGETYRTIFINRKKSGELFEVYHTITPLKDRAGNITHFISTAKDITHQKILEERLKYLAYNDVITGLPNRTLFVDRLKQTISRSEHGKKLIAVLSMDIDRFAFINSAFGPAIGDEVLKEVGNRLKGSVRDGDTVARFGDDEFEITLADVADSQDVIMVMEKILSRVRQPLSIGGEDIVINMSTGVSIYPGDGKDPDTLIRNADSAMLRAKAGGMNSYQFYTPDMNIRANEFVALEKRLIDAIRNNEFVLYYQPYFDTAARELTGMEALIRWTSPESGLVQPGRFMPLLEETGMIIDVGKWIIGDACRQVREWQDKGRRTVPVAVNLSTVQFRQKDLGDVVEKAVRAAGINPRHITLEITESAFMQDVEYTKEVLERLKKIGLAVNIDDFGTGYSSLSYLKRLPVDNLKIDISFIREIDAIPMTRLSSPR